MMGDRNLCNEDEKAVGSLRIRLLSAGVDACELLVAGRDLLKIPIVILSS